MIIQRFRAACVQSIQAACRLYFANPLVGLLWIEDAKVGALAFN